MNNEDKTFVFLEICLVVLCIVLTVILIFAGICMIKDTNATIKVKERIAENGIEITTKQVEELLNNG